MTKIQMDTRDKLFLIGVSIFVIIAIVSVFTDRDCDKEWNKIERKLDYIKSENSIRAIKFFKAYPKYRTNLVSDTFYVADRSTIESIREMINERKTGKWNRPAAEWDLTMRMTLDNNEILDCRISKINNDRQADMTHIYFGTEDCRDKFPNCSLTIGTFLEQLTNYKGNPY